jgi:hypothetical protein
MFGDVSKYTLLTNNGIDAVKMSLSRSPSRPVFKSWYKFWGETCCFKFLEETRRWRPGVIAVSSNKQPITPGQTTNGDVCEHRNQG